MELEKTGIITFLGNGTGVRYVGLFSDSDKTLQAVNYHTGKFADYVCYSNEPLYEANEEQKQFLFNALAKENKYYCEKTKTIKEMKKEFTKKDLRSGMWVENREGNIYLVLFNCDTELYGSQKLCFVRYGSFMTSDKYDEELLFNRNSSFDIIRVYYRGSVGGNTLKFEGTPLIWERETEEDKQMREMQNKLDEMKRAYNDLEKNISETIEKLNNLKK